MIKLRSFLIFIFDILCFFGALVLTLFFRYGSELFLPSFFNHLKVFSVLFIFLFTIFFLTDLYQLKVLKQKSIFLRQIFLSLFIFILISIIFFYFFGSFSQLTPKTNLLIFSLIFFILDFLSRWFLVDFLFPAWKRRILFLGESPPIAMLISDLKSNPQLGYEVIDLPKQINLANLKSLVIKKKIDGIVIPPTLEKKEAFIKLIYQCLPLNIEIFDFRDFYEMIYQKVPLELLDEIWFIKNLKPLRFYEFLKRSFDFTFSFILLFLLSPLILFLIFLNKIFSPGSVFFKQERIGKNKKSFVLYKIRTMEEKARGPLWTTPKDERITKIGRFLRSSHLDEIPQLYNVLRGELSFIGPRAEAAGLVGIFEQRIPYYNIRYTIKSGLTGWAQISYKPSASVEEVLEKLKYDLYYIKNRSFLLDLLILFKTLRLFFVSPK